MRFRVSALLALALAAWALSPAAAEEVRLADLPSKGRSIRPLADAVIDGRKVPLAYFLDSNMDEFQLGGKYDWFVCELALGDNSTERWQTRLSIYLDGSKLKTEEVNVGEKPLSVKIPIKGRQTISFSHFVRPDTAKGYVINPRVIKGDVPAGGEAPDGDATGEAPAGTSVPPTFAIGQKDVDTLVKELDTAIDGKQELRKRLQEGRVALATFQLISIPSVDVARNLSEDLATALIQKGYSLVERGQLDRVLKELKIQNMGLVDPETAQQIGRLAGCDVILLGSVSDRGAKAVVNARLMETATGKALVAARTEVDKQPLK